MTYSDKQMDAYKQRISLFTDDKLYQELRLYNMLLKMRREEKKATDEVEQRIEALEDETSRRLN